MSLNVITDSKIEQSDVKIAIPIFFYEINPFHNVKNNISSSEKNYSKLVTKLNGIPIKSLTVIIKSININIIGTQSKFSTLIFII